MKIRTKIIKKHRKNCGAIVMVKQGDWIHPWYFPNGFRGIRGTVRRDSIGETISPLGGEDWLNLRCNSPDCSGEMIIALDDLIMAAEKK